MRTLSFIGPSKSSGKTTALNFVYSKQLPSICVVSSIGINGEKIDTFDGRVKPQIKLLPGTKFITAVEWACSHAGKYQIIDILSPPIFSKKYLYGKVTIPFDIVLEGPSTSSQIIAMKKILESDPSNTTLLLDGSVDRQFIASPVITDAFYLSINLSMDNETTSINKNFAKNLNHPSCNQNMAIFIDQNITSETKSLLFSDQKIYYTSTQIPALDNELHQQLLSSKEQTLYLAGALTDDLAKKIRPKINIILDNFTMCQTKLTVKLKVKNSVTINSIFMIEHGGRLPNLPSNIPIHNIYREDADAIRV